MHRRRKRVEKHLLAANQFLNAYQGVIGLDEAHKVVRDAPMLVRLAAAL